MTLLKNLAFAVGLFLLSGWIISTYMEIKARPETFREAGAVPPVDAVVVPGASVFRSGKLSPVLLQRMDAALILMHGRANTKLVLSGYAVPNGYSETKAMRDYAVMHGIPSRDVLLDENGRSTFLTLLNCKKKFGLKSIAIVSQGYHLPRGLYIARRLGLHGFGMMVEQEGDDEEWHGREWFSRFKDFILVRVFRFFHAS